MSKPILYEKQPLFKDNIWASHHYLRDIEPIQYLPEKYSKDAITTIPKVKWNKWYRVDINYKTFILDARLGNLVSEIKKSEYILGLKDGWADDEGVSCSSTTYNNTIELLISYAQKVLEDYRVTIKSPEINLCKDGSIDLEWRKDDLILLINILNNSKIDIHYYGEDFQTQTIIKGFLNSLSPNDDLGFWMQKLK